MSIKADTRIIPNLDCLGIRFKRSQLPFGARFDTINLETQKAWEFPDLFYCLNGDIEPERVGFDANVNVKEATAHFFAV